MVNRPTGRPGQLVQAIHHKDLMRLSSLYLILVPYLQNSHFCGQDLENKDLEFRSEVLELGHLGN